MPRWLIASAALLSSLTHAAQVSVPDASGKPIALAQPAQRVITLSPHLAELVAAIGASNKLIAVSRYTDFPAELMRLPQVGDASSLDYERILTLRPDLILAWAGGNRADQIERLQRLGFTVYVTQQPRLRDIAQQLRTLGVLLGTQTAAERAAAEFEQGVNALHTRYARTGPVSVYASIWQQPPMTISAQHWIDEIITLCGGRNVFAQAAGLTPVVAMESIYRHDPQAIIGGGFGGAEEFVAEWKSHHPLRAVREEQIYFIDPDLLQRSTPRLLIAARQVCLALDQAH